MDTQENTVEIVRVGVEDIPQAVPLFDAYRQFYKQVPDMEGARLFLTARLQEQSSAIFLAYRCDKEGARYACGFMQLFPSFSSVSLAPMWILNDLFVAPEARLTGVGHALMDHARAFVLERGARRLTLKTAVDNQRAQSLYESVGWLRDEQFYSYNLSL